jgi:hypothetical protein
MEPSILGLEAVGWELMIDSWWDQVRHSSLFLSSSLFLDITGTLRIPAVDV